MDLLIHRNTHIFLQATALFIIQPF